MTDETVPGREQRLLPDARVLVATGNRAAHVAIAAALEGHGVAVAAADSEETAISMLMQGRIGRPARHEPGSPTREPTFGPEFGLALFAHDLPDSGGFKTAQIARALGIAAASLPIVALAPDTSAKMRDAAYNAAMQGVLVAPEGCGPNAAELQFVLERWLPTRGASAPSTPVRHDNDALTERWRVRRAEALEAVATAMREGRFAGGGAQDLARTMHKLAGTAGLFGEETLGECARRLEHALRREEDSAACATHARDVVAAAA